MGERNIDVSNKFLIGSTKGTIQFLHPLPTVLSKDDALLVAAYIICLIGDDDEWQAVLDAVRET